MAITFVDSNTQDKAAGLDLTFTIPGGAQADDFMVAFVKQSENTSQRIWDDDGGGGNGWTRLTYNRTTSGRDQETAIYWKIHTGTETNPTFTWASGITAEPMSGTLLVYRGVDTLNPITDFGYAQAPNDPNPPNPSVTVDTIPSTVLVFHAATHDDISSVAAPSGYTLRTQVWSGTANDHRNHFTADLIGYNTLGAYTPPDWQHGNLNNTPEYHTYTLVLQEIQPIGITEFNSGNKILWGNTNLILTGFGFGSSQGTGKVEFWSDINGTIKTIQTIDSWSDTSIQIDSIQGALGNNISIYLVITNNNGDVSSPFIVAVGLLPYTSIINELLPDHFWKLNNTYNDTGNTGPVRNMTSGIVGGGVMSSTTLCEDTTHSWNMNGVTVRREIADSPNMNITVNSKERTISLWVQLQGIQQSLGSIWKEGGGVQNLAFLVGLGNVLMWQLADVAATRDNVQAISNFRLAPGRAYHIVGRYSHLDTLKESRLYIDGIKQNVTDGNPMTLGIFDSHSGDVTWGDPDNNLETGGTDIAYSGQENTLISHFATWSDNSINSNAGGLSDAEIFILFERGAKPDVIISSDTQTNMQTALDLYADTIRPDSPLAIRIENVNGGGPLELTADNINFDDRVSLQIQYLGSDTLTWVRQNGSEVDINKFSTPNGGTITIEDNVEVKLTVKDINDNSLLENAAVLLEAASGGDLATGTNIIKALTDSNGEISTTLRFTNPQPVTGVVRRATTGIRYKESGISGTITSNGLDNIIFLINDE